jgi:hypothetical protein
MSAPLPLRFYNPVKELCQKVNLDYETVLGTGLSATMRDAFLNAEIEKPIDQITKEDLKQVKELKIHYNEKFGSNEITTEDKAGERYRLPLNVEHLDPIATIKDSVELREGKAILSGTSTKHNIKWVPGSPMGTR